MVARLWLCTISLECRGEEQITFIYGNVSKCRRVTTRHKLVTYPEYLLLETAGVTEVQNGG